VERLRSALATLVLALACARPEPPPPATPPGSEGISPLVTRAERALESGDVDTAITAYGEALQRTPWNERLRSHLAAAYAERSRRARERGRTSDYAAAEADLRAALALRPDDPVLRRNLAVVLRERASGSRGADADRLREEARALDPDADRGVVTRAEEVERRLDVAHGLVERGEVEAGLLELEPLFAERPDYPGVGRLYAQALVRQGLERQARGDADGASAAFDRAVAVYAALRACTATPCEDPEVRAAHHDRIVNFLQADREDDARAALAEAEAAGLRFPELRRALPVAP
jgi:tetratricopeptide (TPR) repeat protein